MCIRLLDPHFVGLYWRLYIVFPIGGAVLSHSCGMFAFFTMSIHLFQAPVSLGGFGYERSLVYVACFIFNVLSCVDPIRDLRLR